MNLNKLELRDFRNYVNLELEFDPGVNLILGDNAQGKTNLLEAIAFLGSGKSFRAQRTAELVRFGAEFADLTGAVTALDAMLLLFHLKGEETLPPFRLEGADADESGTVDENDVTYLLKHLTDGISLKKEATP